jgi:hypothetical protein
MINSFVENVVGHVPAIAEKVHIKDVRNQLCFQQEEPHAAWPEQTRKTEVTHRPSVSLQDRKLL